MPRPFCVDQPMHESIQNIKFCMLSPFKTQKKRAGARAQHFRAPATYSSKWLEFSSQYPFQQLTAIQIQGDLMPSSGPHTKKGHLWKFWANGGCILSLVLRYGLFLFPQDTWMMMDYHTDSALSPTPPQTDLRATLCMEKRMDVGSSSSLTAGSPLCSV